MREADHPPVTATVPRGGVLLRDIRLWHRGVHNPGVVPRHMLAICYSADRVRPVTIVNTTALRQEWDG